mgnify:CR=1 FL=1
MALERRDGPCAMLFTRQNLDPIEPTEGFNPNQIRMGAYTAYQTKSAAPAVVIVATGSEVPLAIAAAKLLTSVNVRVVSMPCWNVYEKQSAAFKAELIPQSAKLVTVEAGATYGWSQMIDAAPSNVLNIGIDRYGASAPAEIIAEKLGLTTQQVADRIKERFAL